MRVLRQPAAVRVVSLIIVAGGVFLIVAGADMLRRLAGLSDAVKASLDYTAVRYATLIFYLVVPAATLVAALATLRGRSWGALLYGLVAPASYVFVQLASAPQLFRSVALNSAWRACEFLFFGVWLYANSKAEASLRSAPAATKETPVPVTTNESAVAPRQFPDRWSKDLVGTGAIPTTSGFNLGRACYTATEFGAPQVHADQEAVFIISGIGEMLVAGEVVALTPGVAVYVGPGVEHCARRTTEEAVQVVYCHGAV